MPTSFRDRRTLRQLKHLYKKPTLHQNDIMSRGYTMDPQWIQLSRLNHRFVFESPDSYWPDWAEAQLSTNNPKGAHPEQPLSCINTTFHHTLEFLCNSISTHINANGVLSFPSLGWSLIVGGMIDARPQTIFFQKWELRHWTICANVTLNDQLLSATISPFTNHVSVSVTSDNNQTTVPIDTIYIGIVPFTNDGVGAIHSVQYTSDQHVIINDSSIVDLSHQPKNIVCINGSEGNILDKVTEWGMILSAKCPQFQASAGMVLPLETSDTITLSIRPRNTFFVPLLRPITHPFFSVPKQHLDPSPCIAQPNCPVTLQHTLLPTDTYQCIYEFFITHIQSPSHTPSLNLMHANLQALCRFGLTTLAENYLNQCLKQATIEPTLTWIPSSLRTAIMQVACIDMIWRHFPSLHASFVAHAKKASTIIIRSSIVSYISSVSISAVQQLHSHPNRFQFYIKLILIVNCLNHMSTYPWLKQSIIHPKLQSCEAILQLIHQNNAFMEALIQAIPSIPINDLLFLYEPFLQHQAPEVLTNALIRWVKQEWDHQKKTATYSMFNTSEGSRLLYSTVTKSDRYVAEDYLSRITSLGIYQDNHSISNRLSYFPRRMPCYHALLFQCIFNEFIYIDNNRLTITALTSSTATLLDPITTPFGTLSITIEETTDCKRLHIDHAFHTVPTGLYIVCPVNTNHIRLSTEATPEFVNPTTIISPLNVRTIECYLMT